MIAEIGRKAVIDEAKEEQKMTGEPSEAKGLSRNYHLQSGVLEGVE